MSTSSEQSSDSIRAEVEAWHPGVGVPHPTGGYDDEVLIGEQTKNYLRDGMLYREDGPAADDGLGNREWYREGHLHREDGPAKEAGSGSVKEWYFEGKPHRLDGPALVYTFGGGMSYYLIHGVRYSAADHAVLAEALLAGAPFEWALSYLEGRTDLATPPEGATS